MTARDPLADFVAQLPRPLAGVVHAALALGEDFVALASRFADEPGTVALLSGGTLDSARYHILGIRPWLTLREGGGEVVAHFGGTRVAAALDPFTALEALVQRYTLPGDETGLPLSAGLLGYLAYDLKDCLEVLPRTSCDDLGLPRLFMAAPSILLVHDRHTGSTTAHAPILADGEAAAQARLAGFQAELARPAPPPRPTEHHVGPLASGLSPDEYMASVEAIRDYIVRGHVYQVNMSQRFAARYRGDAFSLFARLFAANPAPFFAYLHAGDHRIVSTSPERFVQLTGKTVETRPIKGTRPRGQTPEQDAQLRRELETSCKDDAELSMIVDLLRNDIGKVCAAGSVRVTEHKRVEAYQNVYHLVSVVVGELDEGKNAVDLIRATFPGGSITGCPKIRSMEIIDELEPVRRHIYTGSIGYLGFHGTMDLSIAIRTATITDERLVFSVGGGVVFDSNAADELEETLHKGRTLTRALEPEGGATDEAAQGSAARERFGWQDGKLKPVADMTVSVESDGFAHGYGCFDTIRVQQGRPVMLDAHLARFRRTWERLFTVPFPDLTWNDVIEQVVSRSGLAAQVAAVKLLAAAGNPPDGVRRPTLAVTARAYVHRLAGSPREGLRLAIYRHRRHGLLADHKTTNYLFQRLAAAWAHGQQADEAVLLNADGSVSETNTANLLCRIDGDLVRPFSDHVLPGTFEAAACRLLPTWGLPVVQRRLGVEELENADAVFVTNALMGAVPAVAVGRRALTPDLELCRRLNQALFGADAP